MNYISPTFYFQQADEQLLQTQIPRQQQQQAVQDILVAPSVEDHRSPYLNFQTSSRRKKVPTLAGDDGGEDDENGRNSKKKKLIHRDVERQRRHEMATLYASLRSLLPIEYLKGKRSISDHMNEAANYIRHQQKKLRELTEKRDGLRRVMLASSDSGTFDVSQSSPCVVVRPSWVGMDVVISSGLIESIPLSKVLEILLERGLNVVSCISTKVDQRLIHTLQAEGSEAREVDSCGLQQKLVDLVRPSSWVSR